MESKFYLYWSASQLAAAYLLIDGIESWHAALTFVAAHATAIGLTWTIHYLLIGSDSNLRQRVLGRSFSAFLIGVTLVPLAGPIVGLFLILFLRYFPLFPVRAESFQKINRDVLTVLQRHSGARSLPVTEALLVRGLTRDEAVRSIAIIGEMAWQPAKASIFRYMIRLSPYPNVVLMAIDQLQQKLDAILAEISSLPIRSDNEEQRLKQIADLYHEIVYLDLCDPMMKSLYREKACAYARQAFEAAGRREEDALVLVRYLLEADDLDAAHAIYAEIRDRGDYFFPRWIAYELEFAVRREDRETFENLDLLIASGGGVFIPQRVKQAATAWKRVLTSAWL